MSTEGPKAYPVVYDAENGLQYSFQSGYETIPEASINAITALTGDVTATGPGSAVATIAALAVTAAKLAAHAVTPSKISTTNTDNFVFPNNVTSGNFLITANYLMFNNTNGSLAILGTQGPDKIGIYAGSNEVLRINPSSAMFPDAGGHVVVGGTSTPAASARLEIQGTTGGFLPPRLTTTQRNAIASPAEGLIVYDTSLFSLYEYQNGAWAAVGGGSSAGADTQVIYNSSGSLTGSANLTFDGNNLSLANNKKLILGNSAASALVYDSTNQEVHLDSTGSGLSLTTTHVGMLLATNGGGGNTTPGIGMGNYTSTGNGIELSTTAFLDPNLRVEPSGEVNINSSTTHATSLLSVTSTTKGVLFPRMTTAQKGAIANTAGLVVFDTDLGKLCVNSGTGWETITSV